MGKDINVEDAYGELREAGEQLSFLWRAGRSVDILERPELIAYKDNSDIIIGDAVRKINNVLDCLVPGIDNLEHKPISMEC